MTHAALDSGRLPEDSAFVLAGQSLLPGVSLTATSRFAEDTWRLEPAVLQQHGKSQSLYFQNVPDRYRRGAKQLCYAMLSGPLPPGENRQSVHGIRSTLNDLRRFMRWLDSEKSDLDRLSAVTDAVLTDYQRHLLNLDLTAGSRENARRAVTLLW